MNEDEPCEECNGGGEDEWTEAGTCGFCGGSGCRNCYEGQVPVLIHWTCSRCEGTGIEPKDGG
jgi:DnaJ-class molecular chaperone